MQKLELRQNLKEIIEKTKSKLITEFFNNNKQEPNTYRAALLKLIIDSKAGYDQAIIDEKQSRILNLFSANDLYKTDYYSSIIQFISTNNYDLPVSYLQNSKQINSFYTYHNTLITSYNLINDLLFQDDKLQESLELENYIEAENNGFLSFEITSENNIDFKSFSVVVSNIDELAKLVTEIISTIDKIKFNENPKLILADSGSNTVLSIKLPKEISKSISKIIDDAWLYFTNKSRYNLAKINSNLSESLEIIAKIKKAEVEKIVSPEQAELWRRGIINSTEAIIMNNTLTKSKSEEIVIISNQKLLQETSTKLLTEGKDEISS
ncbi:MAG: hypothetical protein KJ571_18785 [Bacteroidetes bacterium]|nr:hypothetical protein [Bacteroidota bacterium]